MGTAVPVMEGTLDSWEDVLNVYDTCCEKKYNT